jgi:hypothetical protein
MLQLYVWGCVNLALASVFNRLCDIFVRGGEGKCGAKHRKTQIEQSANSAKRSAYKESRINAFDELNSWRARDFGL